MTAVEDLLGGVRITEGLPEALRARITAALVPVHLAGGEWLFRQGDPGEALYLVRSGRLEVVRQDRVVAVLHAGETLGELALLEGGTRAAGVRAVRDSDLLALHREAVVPLLADRDFARALLAQVTRLLRAEPPAVDPASRRAVVALVGDDGDAVAALVDDLAAALQAGGVSSAVLAARDFGCPTGELDVRTGARLDELESQAEVVLLDGGSVDGAWSRVCARQADRVLVIGHGGPPAAVGRPDLRGGDLVMLGDAAWPPGVMDAWGHRLAPRSHHRVRPAHRTADVARMARRVSGRAIGLVLSGGGARALAHVGVLEALEEAGVVVDRLGGTSMGAFVSALAATGRPASAVMQAVRRHVVEARPFADWTVPRRALLRGRDAERMLQRVFADTDVRHLTRSWFAVSAALEDAEAVVHRDGPVWEAVACSMSLPGIAPPRIWRRRIVVDGGVLDNLPVGVMAEDGEGQVVAADLTLQRAFGTEHGLPRVPGIVDTLATTMALSNMAQVERGRAQARLVIEPQVAHIGLLEFAEVDAAVEAGRDAGRRALAEAGDLLHPAVTAGDRGDHGAHRPAAPVVAAAGDGAGPRVEVHLHDPDARGTPALQRQERS